MRPGTLLAALTALILAACDVVASPPPPVTANFTLASQGMLTNGNTNLIGWGTDEPNFIQIMVQMTGNPPTDIVENTECGAGPMRMASFPGGLVLNFQSGASSAGLRPIRASRSRAGCAPACQRRRPPP